MQIEGSARLDTFPLAAAHLYQIKSPKNCLAVKAETHASVRAPWIRRGIPGLELLAQYSGLNDYVYVCFYELWISFMGVLTKKEP